MELNEYQELAMRTSTASSSNFTYMTYGLTAEVGEVMDKVAKAVRKDIVVIHDNRLRAVIGREEEFAEVVKGIKAEIGDCLWFIAGIAAAMNVSLEAIAESNIEKLADRQARGVIIGEGDNR